MTPEHPITRFGLIRHAETRWNREKRIQGHRDSPLTEAGKEKALKWGRVLASFAWHRILSSDLGRALETANRVNRRLNLAIEADPGLREQNWGDWEGSRIQTLEDQEALGSRMGAGWLFCPPGGEDRESVWVRGVEALQAAAAKWPGETILVVTHEGMIKSLIYRLVNRRFLPSEPPLLQPEHLHWLCRDQNGLRIEKLNAVELGTDLS